MLLQEQRYSHRNGETDPPTIAGHFGHRDPGEKRGSIIEIVIERGKAMWLVEAYWSRTDDLPEGEYWGPIIGPWDNES